jgi:hypothetical protein
MEARLDLIMENEFVAEHLDSRRNSHVVLKPFP